MILILSALCLTSLVAHASQTPEIPTGDIEDAGTLINFPPEYYTAPLEVAVARKDLIALKMLLSQKASVTRMQLGGSFSQGKLSDPKIWPLMRELLLYGAHLEPAYNFLMRLKRGASEEKPMIEDYGDTELMHVAVQGYYQDRNRVKLQRLLRQGMNIAAKNHDGHTVLQYLDRLLKRPDLYGEQKNFYQKTRSLLCRWYWHQRRGIIIPCGRYNVPDEITQIIAGYVF